MALAPRPLPLFVVTVAGQDLSARLVSARVRLVLSQPGLVDLALDLAADGPASGPATGGASGGATGGASGIASGMAPGDPVSLAVGMPPVPLFAGTLTAITRELVAGRAPVLRLRGHDALHALRQRSEAEMYEAMTLAEIAGRIAARHGLTLDARSEGPRWPQVLQARQSDLALLQGLCAATGHAFRLQGSVLLLLALDAAAPEETAVAIGQTVLDMAVEQNGFAPQGAVTVESWDPALAQAGIEFHGDGAPVAALRGLAQPDGSAAFAARALAADRAARTWVVDGRVLGMPAALPGDGLALAGSGLPPGLRPLLTEVVHSVDPADGFVTALSTRPQPVPPPRRGAEATLGIVQSVADPQGLGRVQVQLPAYGGLVAYWAAVALPGLGQAAGLMALPQPGDRVLVLLVGGDLAQGVVIGGLIGPDPPQDTGVTGDRVERYHLRLPGGQHLVLDDGDGSARLTQRDGTRLDLTPQGVDLQAANGSRLTLRDDGALLHSATDLRIAAPGRALRILADHVDFERG